MSDSSSAKAGQSMADHEHGLRFVNDEGRCLACSVKVERARAEKAEADAELHRRKFNIAQENAERFEGQLREVKQKVETAVEDQITRWERDSPAGDYQLGFDAGASETTKAMYAAFDAALSSSPSVGDPGLQKAWELSGGAGEMPGLGRFTLSLARDEVEALTRAGHENAVNAERADAWLRATQKLKAVLEEPTQDKEEEAEVSDAEWKDPSEVAAFIRAANGEEEESGGVEAVYREALKRIAESAWVDETVEDCAKACKSIARRALREGGNDVQHGVRSGSAGGRDDQDQERGGRADHASAGRASDPEDGSRSEGGQEAARPGDGFVAEGMGAGWEDSHHGAPEPHYDRP